MAYHHQPSTMRRVPVRLFTGSAIALTIALGGLGGSGIMQAAQQPPAPPAGAVPLQTGANNAVPQDAGITSGRVRVLIEMQQAPAAVTYAAVLEQAAARTPQTLAAAATAGQTQMAAINAQQQQVAAAIAAAPIGAAEMFRVQRAINGIAATVDANSLAALRRLPGVKAVHRLELEYPNNSTSTPFVGAPSVWSGTGGVPIAATGAGIRIGIIDTGVDYQHATFGGTGILADYQANDRTAAPDAYYPTAKVVGGRDFVGDAYNGGGTAVPDNDPMDCNGHGTHVAATAAGFGVNGDGTTFAGPFGPAAPFGSMRIGPGTAPQAQVYALRVFGCGGGTSHTVQAIDWAMDPNGDNDLSDHLDVINMSLGSSFGSLTTTSSIAADNAARAGVIVVSSAGNSGDTYFITGAPGAASRTISTAAINDGNGGPNGDTIGSFSSRGPRSGPGPRVLKPDIAAPGVGISSAQTGVVCTGVVGSTGCIVSNGSGFIPDSQALSLNGTSMAAPHIAGIMALLRQLHPSWTVEELKALVMNRALHDVTTLAGGSGQRYGPGRVGAGRVDAALAAQTSVVAFNAEEPGLVSVSFDIPEVVGTATQTKTIRIVNHGTTAQTYQLAIDTVVDAPGVAYSLPGTTTVTVQPGQTLDVPVKIDATAAQMDHTRDASTSATQTVNAPAALAGDQIPRHSATEESGYVTLSQTGVTQMRVPIYAVTRPASQMSGVSTITTGGAPTGFTTIPLSGTDVCTGTLGAGPDCIRSTGEVSSLVSAFELQVVSPRRMDLPAYWDLQYTGVTTSTTRIWFGVSTWGDWSSPSDTSVNIYVDTDLNGTWDRVISQSNSGAMARKLFGQSTQGDTDAFITLVYTPPPTNSAFVTLDDGTPNFVNGASATQADSGLYNSNVLFFGAEPSQLGLASTNSPFRYKVVTCPGWAPLCQYTDGFVLDEAAGPFFWNGGARGLNFNSALLMLDLNGNSLPVTWNTANMTTNGSIGALLLHHYNGAGQRAQVVTLDAAQRTDLSITLSASPTAPASGEQTVLTVTVTNNSVTAANAVTVATDLPLGLTHVSNDGGGAYVPYDTWTVGTLAPGASATLHITTTADDTEYMQARAVISTVTPIDSIAANNEAVLTFNAPVLTDLRITSVPAQPATVAGNAFGSTITITNQGAWPAHNVSIANSFAAGTGAIQSGTPSAGVFSGGTGLWQIATLAPGASATLNLSAVAIAGPTISVQSLASSGVTDPNSSNNVALASLNVTTRATAAAATLVTPAVALGQPAALTVVITDTEASGTKSNPEGTITFGSSVVGDVFGSPSCVLTPIAMTTDRSSCAVTVTPATIGLRTLSANYGGSGTHASSGATSDLTASLRPTTITAANATAVGFLEAHEVTLTANVMATAPVNEPVNDGTVTFTVRNNRGQVFNAPVTAAVAANGSVSAVFVMPGGQPPQTLSITAEYSGTAIFAASIDFKELTLTPPESTPTYMLAEGATGQFFDTDVLLANPNDVPAEARITFLEEDGTTTEQTRMLAPLSRMTIHVDEIEGLEATAISTVVTSTYGLPLVVERTMKWDATGYGAHTDKATAGPALTWYFAEGSEGYFSTFLLLANPGAEANTAHVTYFRENEGPLVRDYDLLPSSRYTVAAANDAGLVDRAFGIEVTFDRPGLAERATYFGTAPFWSGGHASAGSTAPSTEWFLAEGATGSFFNTFVLLANPNDEPAQVTMTYLPDSGLPVTRMHDVPGRGRKTINIALEDATLASAAMGLRATSDRPIVVERAQYWPQPVWIEGHASAGVTQAATRWGLAEGRVGGSSNDQTYVLLANAGAEDATVTISFLRTSGAGGPVIKQFTVPAGSRRNVAVNGASGDVPELSNEQFGALIESTQPIFVERSLYSDAAGITWASGTNATATRLP